jgi:hypothetical protein
MNKQRFKLKLRNADADRRCSLNLTVACGEVGPWLTDNGQCPGVLELQRTPRNHSVACVPMNRENYISWTGLTGMDAQVDNRTCEREVVRDQQ